ncbi:MAG: response regulator [Lachnospiraceae bacterium]|nr:response regulator [Lachnospiraceae bacterium]
MSKKFNIIKKYITNEDLAVSHRMMNIILLMGIFISPVCLIFDLAIGSAIRSAIPLIFLFLLFVVSFVLANVVKKANLAGIVLTVVSTNCLVPYLYFRDGGRYSGMPMWLLLSSVFAWLLIKGWAVIAVYVSNIIVYAGIFYYEYTHPETVTRLADGQAESIDIVCGIYVIVLILGIIFKFQSKLYEKKKAELEEKENELMEINEKLKKANEAKSVFLASMSHEIRTPINAIVGMNEMVLRESDDDNVISYASNIESASGTLLSLVNDILDFTKIDSGLMEIIPDDYELYSVLNDCYTLLELRAAGKGLSLELVNAPDIPANLYGDEIRIRQIITNLLTNAVKYTDNGSITMTVGFTESDTPLYLSNEDAPNERLIDLRVSVKDTGRGISEEGLKSLFNSFTRVDEKKNKNIEGTGLGLAITKQLTELMGGRIDVTSQEGVGSEFTVVIPQRAVGNATMGDFSERFRRKKNAGRKYKVSFVAPEARILVVDDLEVNLKVVTMLLKNTEAKIDTATSGEACLKAYESNDYDVVLLDHMMPEMDGMETLKQLKKSKKYMAKRTPVVALTANATLGAEKIYLDTGFDDYLTKPVKGAELEAMILKYIPEELVKKLSKGDENEE